VALPFVWGYLAVGKRSVGEEGGGDVLLWDLNFELRGFMGLCVGGGGLWIK